MANLKWYIFFIFLAMIHAGCENDELNPSDRGLIIGEWEGYSLTLVFEDGSSEAWQGNPCSGYILNFFEDGRVRWVDFIEDTPNSCVENPITEPFGEWERISNGKYVFNLKNSNPGCNNRTGTSNSDSR